jgi:protein SCO1/2
MKKSMIKQVTALCFYGFIVAAVSVSIGNMWSSNFNKDNFGAAQLAAMEPAAGDDAKIVSASKLGGDFDLVDENGNAVTTANYPDTHKMYFFGFSHCPDVCPAGLQKMALTLNKLGKKADKVTPFFVSVDPSRDTPEVMNEYTDLFHEDIIGLTGTKAQIDAIKSKYKVYAAKEEGVDPDHYMMMHSAYIYFMTPDNELIDVFNSDRTADDIAKALKKTL